MSESIDLPALVRYFDGSASAEERVRVETWIGSDQERRAAVAQLRAAWLDDKRKLDAPYDTNVAWNRLALRLRAESDQPPTSRRAVRAIPQLSTRPATRSKFRVGGLAAAAVIAAAVGGSWLALHKAPTPETAQAPAMREYATVKGQRAIVRLLDGTEITLNVDSRLRVPATYGTERRDVYLQGEAFVSVAHDAGRPFAVHTMRGIVRDVGTKFGIRAYGEDESDRVVVAEGVVAIGDSADSARTAAHAVALHAGQVATLSAAGRVSVLAAANVAREIAWTRGRLEFQDAPLGDVARRLGRWYDLNIVVTDPELSRRAVTGSYGEEPIAHVLTVLTAAVGARYEWRGRTVTISAARAAP